jgi:D-amino-acid dehydrogenase
MKVVVLGSGVIGVTTAYYLAKQGHEVVVVERRAGSAMETSHANAGQVSPGYSAPWAAPDIPFKVIKWMMMEHSPLLIRWKRIDPDMWLWGAKMLRNCTAARYKVNKTRMVRLSNYSRECLIELRRDTGIEYDERSQGTLQLFRTQKQLDGIGKDVEILKEFDSPYEVLDREGCIAAEPGLRHVRHKFAGGLRLVNDETGDCLMFTQKLTEIAKGLGVQFMFATNVERLMTNRGGPVITGVHTDHGPVTGDAYVLSLGSFSTRMLRPLGIDIPVYPVKGYSITLPVTDAESAPVSTIMDETHKVAITRLGSRIRVAGTAELGGYNLYLDPKRRATVEYVVSDLFPRGGDVSQSVFWTGLRPMTPDGTPCLGPTKYPNLYLNTGHGTLGWTQSCGSGKLLADLVTGNTPEIETEGLFLDRYR